VYLGAALYTNAFATGWAPPDSKTRALLAWVLPTTLVPGLLLAAEVVLQGVIGVHSARTAAAAQKQKEREVESGREEQRREISMTSLESGTTSQGDSKASSPH
jgi:hypothetical protein